MYKLRFLEEASASLEILDKTIARRIGRKIAWLAENIESIEHKGLRGGLSGLSKLREGDYRIIYQVVADEKLIIIRFIGHRRDVYRRGQS
jgi:mRNA interferase RelE/StbE